MRKPLRFLAITLFSLWLINHFFPQGLIIKNWPTLLQATAVLTLANLIVKPAVNILLLPFNLLSLGTLRWVVNGLMLWLTTRLVSGITVSTFTFTGLSWQGFIVPSIHFPLLGAYLFLSFALSLTTALLLWLFK